MNSKFIGAILISVLAVSACSKDIKTLNGVEYKNANVIDSNPSGIDISYKNASGVTVVKELKFSNLPANICKEYGHDPASSAQFNAQVNKYSSKNLYDTVQNQQQEITRLKKELNQKSGDYNVDLNYSNTGELIFSHRNSVKLKAVGTTSKGVLAVIEQTYSGKAPTGRIMVNGLNISNGSTWSGFIYPVGIKAGYGNLKNIPVYSTNLNQAVKLQQEYLNMYGDYGASQQQQQSSDSDTSSSTTDSSNTSDTSGDIDYNDYYDGEPYYYIGGNPYPPVWYNNNWAHHPHTPYRPYPPNRHPHGNNHRVYNNRGYSDHARERPSFRGGGRRR